MLRYQHPYNVSNLAVGELALGRERTRGAAIGCLAWSLNAYLLMNERTLSAAD